jgi:hypothetical protein
VLGLIYGLAVLTPLVVAIGNIGLRLLPLISNRVNDRAVRLEKAKNEHQKG